MSVTSQSRRLAPVLRAVTLLLSVVAGAAAAGDGDPFAAQLRPLLEKYCFDCHDADSRKGGVDLSRFATEVAVQRDPRRWEGVARLIRDREMPPPKKQQPTVEERDLLVDGISRSLRNIDYSLLPKDPGPKLIHRLSRLEYNRTVQDLFGVDLRPADGFPADGSGGAGFDNHAGALFLPPILMEKYLSAAQEVLSAAAPDQLFPQRPGVLRGERAAATSVLEYHTFRAFRGPVSAEEIDGLLGLYDRTRGEGADWEEAVRTCLKAVLISPRFLYRIEADPPGTTPGRVSGYELATRLAYFLWAAPPDDTLLDLAASGRLHDPEVLRTETRRLLADPRADAFAEDFVVQWLGIRRLKTGTTAPDRRKFPEYSPELRDAMVEEPVRFFQALLREDRSLLELVDADYTFANPELAKFYDLASPPTNGWVRVRLTDRNRGGLVTMPAVLTLTSFPQRTSPVLRGKWILEEILGTPPPPPPPSVAGLPPDDRPKDGLTFRQRLEKHRTKVECAACHARMDPLGFGLENFDAMGRWRDRIGDVAVDASGEFNTGEKFTGPQELRALLLGRQEEFLRNLTEKMLSYALGRGLEYYDAPAVHRITEKLRQNELRSSLLIEGITSSFPFQHRRGASAAPDQG